MAAKLVPTVRTQYTQYELTKAMIEAWNELYGQLPSKKQIAIVWSQNALETGMSVSMWGNNVGNTKYVPQPTDDETVLYQQLANTWEMINGQKVVFQPPNPATWFRAFATLKDGIAYQFNFLKNNRYKAAWNAVIAGDPTSFVHLLKTAGYFTASEADYLKAEMSFFNQFMASTNFEKAVQELSAPIVDQPIVHPEIDWPTDYIPYDPSKSD